MLLKNSMENKIYNNYNFYIFFSAGYENRVSDVEKDIVDIFVVDKRDFSKVYIGTLYTLKVINEIIETENNFIIEKNIVIIKNLYRETIYHCVKHLFDNKIIDAIFSEIGSYESVFGVNEIRYDLL